MSVRAAGAPTEQATPQWRTSTGAPVQTNRHLDKVLAIGFAKLQIKPCAKTSMNTPGPSAEDDAELLVNLWEDMQEEDLHDFADQVNFGESHAGIWSERQTGVLTTAFEKFYEKYVVREKSIPHDVIKPLIAKLNKGDPAEKIATPKNVRDWIKSATLDRRNDKSETTPEYFTERQRGILDEALKEHLESKRHFFDPLMINRVIGDLNALGEPKVADEANVKRWFGEHRGRASKTKNRKEGAEKTRPRFSEAQLKILHAAYNSLHVAGKTTRLLDTTKKDLMDQLNAIPDGKVITDTDQIRSWFQGQDRIRKKNNVASDPGDVEAQFRMLISTHDMESQKLDKLKYSGDPEMRRALEAVYQKYMHNDDVDDDTMVREVFETLKIPPLQNNIRPALAWFKQRREVENLDNQIAELRKELGDGS